MRRLLAGWILCTTLMVARAAAQSSEFGIRGLGLPGRELSARATALGGGIGLFDGESSVNPAAIGALSQTTALFTMMGDYRNSTTPAGSLSGRDTRFPQILVGGPIPHRPFSLSFSYSMYTDRDFTVVSDGIESPRGVPVGVHDTLSSRGGLDDLRAGAAWIASSRLTIGAAFHFITGSNRLTSRRFWDDTTYLSPAESAELSYSGIGASLGFMWQPLRGVEVAGTYRHDGTLNVNRDSTGNGQVKFPSSTIGTLPMPNSWGLGVRFTPIRRVQVSGSYLATSWSTSDSALVAQNGIGSQDTKEASLGLEIFRNARRPLKYPLRLGVHYATLPFLLTDDPQPKEYGISIGTGRRFAQERGGFDIALEHVWRSQASGYSENATILTFGISVRPGGISP